MGGFVDRVRLVLGGADDAPHTDGQLLRAFVADRNADAFAILVRRHGPLVLGVCRRVLGRDHAAEDAFQATFLVLARKAATVAPREGLAGWLYAVAYHTALRARTMADRRRKRETLVADVPEPAPDEPAEPAPPEALAALGEELAQLPEKFRTAVVLCELQGLSRRDAAERLGVPEGTLSSRLAAARKTLADRLRKRGVALPVGAVAVLLADLGSVGAVPPPLSAAAATLGTASPAVPSAVSTLADGVIRTMFLKKLLVSTVGLAVVVVVAGLAGGPIVRAVPRADDDPAKPVAAARQGDRPGAAPKKAAGSGKLLVYRTEQLITVDPDGTNQAAVTEKREGLHPSSGWLSPDGKRVLYARPELPKLAPGVREGRADPRLFVQTIGEKETTDLGVSGISACWSADGSEVALTNFLEKGEGHEHFVVNVKTQEKTALKLPADHIITDWSRDGKFFLTMSARVYNDGKFATRLYLMNRDGTEHKALPEDPRNLAFGRLSPDGKKVLCRWMSGAGGKDQAAPPPLAVVDVATGKVTAVEDFPLNATPGGYCWSPDGKRIAYTWQHADGKPDDPAREIEGFLVVCDPDGKNAKTVLSEKRRDGRPAVFGTVDWR